MEGTILKESEGASAAFIQELRRVLQQLYDPAELTSSPLIELLCANRGNSPAALRRALLEGIESLRPTAGVPPQANAWRMYRILYYRYVEQTPQREVATSLALSVRQLRRQQNLAIKVLADHLWRRYALGSKALPTAAAPEPPAPQPPTAADQADTWEQEYAWLKTSQPSDLVNLAELVQGVLETVGPFLKATGVTVAHTIPQDLPRVTAQLITLRQALVSIFTLLARHAPGGRIELSAAAQQGAVTLHISARPATGSAPSLGEQDLANLEMMRQLVALSAGTLHWAEGAEDKLLTVALALPATEQVTILLIDDHADTRQLFRRYLADSPYRLIEAGDPEQALALAAEWMPQIILLDVMLPDVDGWELLGRLREHPATRGTPVIVCTVLRQEQLALMLGAAGFLQKPVSREALLQALAAQLQGPRPESR